MQQQETIQETIKVARELLETVLGKATVHTLSIMLVEEILDTATKDSRAYLNSVLNTIEKNFVTVSAQRAHEGSIKKARISAAYVREHEGMMFDDVITLADNILSFEAQAVHNQTADTLQKAFATFVDDCLELNKELKKMQPKIEKWNNARVAAAKDRLDKRTDFKNLLLSIAGAGVKEGLSQKAQDFVYAVQNLRNGSKPTLAGHEVSILNQKDDEVLDAQLAEIREIWGEINGQ